MMRMAFQSSPIFSWPIKLVLGIAVSVSDGVKMNTTRQIKAIHLTIPNGAPRLRSSTFRGEILWVDMRDLQSDATMQSAKVHPGFAFPAFKDWRASQIRD